MPPPASSALRRVDALLQAGLRIARAAPTGRMALAQVAGSLDPEWIPRPWGDEIAAELESARAAADEPLPFRTVEKVLRDAWGGRPADELDDLDSEPVAVRPTSQVHRGVLEGAPVAVKVLRPGLASAVRQDLALLDSLLAPIGAAFPAVDARALLREVRERVMEELDLEHESTTQRRFHRALRDHPEFVVPAPHTRLAHDNVLVSDWADGVPIDRAPDRDAAAAKLVRFVIGAARFGVMHADPDPRDVLVLGDGRIAILDFGAVRAVEPERVENAMAALEAFAAGDGEAFGAATERLGALPAEHGPEALELARHALGDLAGAGPARLDTPAVVQARDRLFRRSDSIVRLMLAGSSPPQDLWPTRAVAQLFGTIARAGATGDWLELSRQALREGWDST